MSTQSAPSWLRHCVNLSAYNIMLFHSYLKTLLVPFNEVTSKFIEKLRPLADGATKVPMKLRFGEFTLDVISKVKCRE